MQIVVGLAVGTALTLLARAGYFKTDLVVPFVKGWYPDLGWLYLPFAAMVVDAKL